MFRRTIVTMAVLALVSANIGFSEGDYEADKDYGLVESIHDSDVVAVGTVVTLTGVYRENMPEEGKNTICTDVLVAVDTMIKGSPNFGKRHIKFTVEGGTAYVPSLDEVITLEISDGATFKVGEKVLFLLSNSYYPYYARYPYGNMRLTGWDYGKRLIKDDTVTFVYKKGTDFKPMQLPLELAKSLAKASVTHKTSFQNRFIKFYSYSNLVE